MIEYLDGFLRSVVDVQTDCALPLARPCTGKSGEGLTVLVAAVMRLSQKTSSAFARSAAGFGLRAAGAFLCAPSGAAPGFGAPGKDK